MDLVYCYHFEGASFQIKSSYILDLYFFLMYRGIMIMVMVIFISVTKSLRKVHMCDTYDKLFLIIGF